MDVGFGSRPRCHWPLRPMALPGLLAQQPRLGQQHRRLGPRLQLNLRLGASPPAWTAGTGSASAPLGPAHLGSWRPQTFPSWQGSSGL